MARQGTVMLKLVNNMMAMSFDVDCRGLCRCG